MIERAPQSSKVVLWAAMGYGHWSVSHIDQALLAWFSLMVMELVTPSGYASDWIFFQDF